MKADASTEKEVMKILEDLNDILACRDVQRALSLFATDADISLFGSEEGETSVGRTELESFFRRIFQLSSTLSFEWKWHLISIEGLVAWVVAKGLIHLKSIDKHLSSPYRITLVLVKRGDKWFIMHGHGSQPAAKNK